MGDRRSLTGQLPHGNTRIAKVGPQLVLGLQDVGQGRLTPEGGEQEVGFQNCPYAEDFHIFLSSPNFFPELQFSLYNYIPGALPGVYRRGLSYCSYPSLLALQYLFID